MAAVGISCIALGTGGLGSPLVFMLSVLAIPFGIFLDRPASLWILGASVLIVVGGALLLRRLT